MKSLKVNVGKGYNIFIEKGILKGTSKGLDLSKDMIRILVILYRMR